MSDVIQKRLRKIDLSMMVSLAGAVGLTVLLGVLPLYRTSKDTQNQSKALRDGIASLDGLSSTLSQVESQIKQTETRLAGAETLLPTSSAMDQFMTQLAQVAENAGLRVNAISPRNVEQAENYRVIPIEINGSGSFETCYKFLTGLHSMNRLTRLDSVSIDLESDANDEKALREPQCRMDVGISTFIAR